MTIQTPPIGWPIQFLPKNNHKDPFAAFVTGTSDNGMVMLNYLCKAGGGTLATKFIHHTDSEFIKKNPHVFQVGNMPGTWRFVPGLEFPPKTASEQKPKDEDAPRSEGDDQTPNEDETPEAFTQEVRDRIDELLVTGHSIDDIHMKVRNQGIKKAELEDYVKALKSDK